MQKLRLARPVLTDDHEGGGQVEQIEVAEVAKPLIAIRLMCTTNSWATTEDLGLP